MLKSLWGLVALCLLVACAVIIFHPSAVLAAATTVSTSAPTTVTIGWGAIAQEFVQGMAILIMGAVTYGLRQLPAQIVGLLNMFRADQLLAKAIGWGVNSIDGAVAGKTMTVDVGRAVTAKALQFAVDHGSSWLLAWLGGPVAIAQKIWARLPLEEGASTIDFNHLAAQIIATPPQPGAGLKTLPGTAAAIAILFAVAILPALGGCAAMEDAAGSLAVSAVASTPVPGQAKTVYAAELTFDLLVREAQHYVDSGLATDAQKAIIHAAVIKAQAINKQVRTAAESGTNAATAALLASLNAANLDFSGALAALGVTTKSAP